MVVATVHVEGRTAPFPEHESRPSTSLTLLSLSLLPVLPPFSPTSQVNKVKNFFGFGKKDKPKPAPVAAPVAKPTPECSGWNCVYKEMQKLQDQHEMALAKKNQDYQISCKRLIAHPCVALINTMICPLSFCTCVFVCACSNIVCSRLPASYPPSSVLGS